MRPSTCSICTGAVRHYSATAYHLTPPPCPPCLTVQELSDITVAAHRLTPPCPPCLTVQELSDTLWALARLRHIPEEAWMTMFWEVSAPQLQHYEPQQLATTLWAAVQLGQAPPRGRWLRKFVEVRVRLCSEVCLLLLSTWSWSWFPLLLSTWSWSWFPLLLSAWSWSWFPLLLGTWSWSWFPHRAWRCSWGMHLLGCLKMCLGLCTTR